jgi:hypothetical protein
MGAFPLHSRSSKHARTHARKLSGILNVGMLIHIVIKTFQLFPEISSWRLSSLHPKAEPSSYSSDNV